MSRKPAGAGRRVDAGSKALTALARKSGVEVEPINGSIDAIWWLGTVVRLVDYKGTHDAITSKQGSLIARGCPLRFVSSSDQVLALVAEMKREALR